MVNPDYTRDQSVTSLWGRPQSSVISTCFEAVFIPTSWPQFDDLVYISLVLGETEANAGTEHSVITMLQYVIIKVVKELFLLRIIGLFVHLKKMLY